MRMTVRRKDVPSCIDTPVSRVKKCEKLQSQEGNIRVKGSEETEVSLSVKYNSIKCTNSLIILTPRG